MQKSSYNDIQMLQQQIMFKQLQELQKQQHLQELGDTRQHNYINQLPTSKSASGGQFPTLINGTPVHDASQMFMAGNTNLIHGTSPIVQGFPNGCIFSQAQSQTLHSMAMLTQQHDVSLYGTPITSAGNNLNHYTHLQGAFDDSANIFTKSNRGQMERPVTQSSAFDNFFMGDNYNVSLNQVCISDGTFISKQVCQVPTQGLNHGILGGNFEQRNFLQRNVSGQEHGRKEEKSAQRGVFPGKSTGPGLSQNLASLNLLEQKILFSVDDNSWEASFFKNNNLSTRGFDNTVEHGQCLNGFPSIQSGSWSALMQSAVSEASSSDTGLQEKWSGLSFQSPDLSTENQPPDFVDSGKHINWIDNSLGNASAFTSKEFLLHSSNMSSSFHGSPLSGVQLPMNMKEGLCSEFSHDSVQLSPEVASKYSDFNVQQKSQIDANQAVQSFIDFQRAWPDQTYGHVESGVVQQTALSYGSDDGQYDNSTVRDAEPLTHSEITIQNFYDNKIVQNKIWSDDVDEGSGKDSYGLWRSNNDHVAGSVGMLDQVKSGRVNTMADRECSLSNNVTTIAKSNMDRFDHAVDQETRPSIINCFLSENSNGNYFSNASEHTISGNRLRGNLRLTGSDFQIQSGGNQQLSDQVLFQQLPHELNGSEQAYIEQLNLMDNVSNSGMNLQKGQSPDFRFNTRIAEELPLRNNVASFDGLPAFQSSNVAYQTREDGTRTITSSIDSTPLSQFPLAAFPDASLMQSYNKPSGSHCSGLRLGPPVQHPNSYGFYQSQGAAQKRDSIGEVLAHPPYLPNHLQNENLPVASMTSLSPRMTMSGMERKLVASNPRTSCTSCDASSFMKTNQQGQQFPESNALPVTQASMSASQVRFPTKPSNTRQHLSCTEHGNILFSSRLSLDSANSRQEIASWAPLQLNDHNLWKPCNNSQEIGGPLMNLQGSDYGKGQPHVQESVVVKTLSETNFVASGVSMPNSQQQGLNREQRNDNKFTSIFTSDLEAFGHSLTPNIIHQDYSRLHQLHSVMNADTDPSKRVSDRSLANSEHNASKLNLFSSGNKKILSFAPVAIADQSALASAQPLVLDTSERITKFGPTDSQSHSSNNLETNQTVHSQINFQIVNQGGTLKNGQIFPSYNARTVENSAKQFSLAKPHETSEMIGSTAQVNSGNDILVKSICSYATTPAVALKQLSSAYTLPTDVSSQNLSALRAKRRKISAYEFLPWHREVIQGSHRQQQTSKAQIEWAHATNLLIDTVGDEAEKNEDMKVMHRPNHRLILTTQLMQQLFQPAPLSILSADAKASCETIGYFTARLTLGGACCLTNVPLKSSDTCDMECEKSEMTETIGGQSFSEAVEELTSRAQKLEDDFVRLDKKASILDIQVESRELDKFSVANRFAKFHIRVQARATETSFIGTTPAPKTMPQRYVKALSMPRSVPEGAHCLSL